MADLTLHVELPSYSHSFPLTISSTSNILSLKQQIHLVCPGGPKVEGQKLVSRGRFLRDDEVVGDIWKSEEEVKVVHMAVHPTAWTAPPDSVLPSRSTLLPSPMAESMPPAVSPSQSYFYSPLTRNSIPTSANMPSLSFRPPLYVFSKHNDALSILTYGRLSDHPRFSRGSIAWTMAVQSVERSGYIWPDILDEEFPTNLDVDPGVSYERVTIESQSYLILRTPTASPNPLQVHALKVLTYTFSILSLPLSPYPSPTVTPIMPVPLPIPNVNQLLHHVGLPNIRLARPPLDLPNPPQHENVVEDPVQNGDGGIFPNIRDFPLRPLLAPFVMLLVRTLLLVYFVSPARKPVYGIIIVAWILYEIGWGHVREAVLDGVRRQRERERGINYDEQRAAPRPPEPAQQAAPNPGPRPQLPNQLHDVLDRMAQINFAAESEALDARPPVLPEPSPLRKAAVFVMLLVVTLHPAVWDRRREALKAREGKIKLEAGIRDGGGDGDVGQRRRQFREELVALHRQRPSWLRQYEERVRHNEWVDG